MIVSLGGTTVTWDELQFGDCFVAHVDGATRFCMKVYESGEGHEKLDSVAVLCPGHKDYEGAPGVFETPSTVGIDAMFRLNDICLSPVVSSLIGQPRTSLAPGTLVVNKDAAFLMVRMGRDLCALRLADGGITTVPTEPRSLFARWVVRSVKAEPVVPPLFAWG